jgi:DMSO/TMAO reductase YedYZ molybdopterin-dependent catalytic subunit
MKKILCLIMLVMNLMLLASCTGTDGTSGATESRYQEMEIREYNGTRLDPSIGLRDNSIKGTQHVDINTYTLKISGLVNNPVSLSYNDVLAMTAYEKLITLHCVEGWDATVLWKGVLLKDIIDKASAEGTANTVIFHSVDGYTTSLPLQDIIDKNIIMAYSSNRITLPAELGYPFIVVAEDKLGYKWARWVTEIELSDNPNYKGYWETRGFDNNADVK